MKRTVELFALLVLLAGLAGCLNQVGFEKTVASRVRVGMAKQDAVAKLGELKLACIPARSTANGNDRLDCSRSRPRVLDGCVQRVYVDVSREGAVIDLAFPEPACAGL